MTGYSMGAAARVGRKEGIVIQTIRRLRTNSTAMFGLIVLALLILLIRSFHGGGNCSGIISGLFWRLGR